MCRAAIESLAENFSDRGGRSGILVCAARPAGRACLQDAQHRRFDDRSQEPEISAFRLGFGSSRRSRQYSCSPAVDFSDCCRERSLPMGGARQTMPLASHCAIMDCIVRPIPAGRKPRWRARSMCKLAGPRIYGGALVSEPMINGAGRAVATVADVETGVSIFYRACGSLTVLAAMTALLFSIV